MTKKCKYCGKEFETKYSRKKYCSPECAKEVHKEQSRQSYKRNKKSENLYSMKKCKQCGNLFKPKHWRIQYCSDECRKEAKQELRRKWYRNKYQKKKPYPCYDYSFYNIPTDMCLNCSSERCRFDNDTTRKTT